jgi:hypothetical protein
VEPEWYYADETGSSQGPFTAQQVYSVGFFELVCCIFCESRPVSLWATDA